LTIRLNGDPLEVGEPLTVAELLARLQIDSRRVAVEHNCAVVKHDAFDRTAIGDGDEIEIVNFVGGGSSQAAVTRDRLSLSDRRSPPAGSSSSQAAAHGYIHDR
jgi:sulfur carrier protein